MKKMRIISSTKYIKYDLQIYLSWEGDCLSYPPQIRNFTLFIVILNFLGYYYG